MWWSCITELTRSHWKRVIWYGQDGSACIMLFLARQCRGSVARAAQSRHELRATTSTRSAREMLHTPSNHPLPVSTSRTADVDGSRTARRTGPSRTYRRIRKRRSANQMKMRRRAREHGHAEAVAHGDPLGFRALTGVLRSRKMTLYLKGKLWLIKLD